jgi:PST family polysaccharide transporter
VLIKDNTILRNFLYLGGARFTTLAIGLLQVMYVARTIGPTAYGVIAYIAAILTYCTGLVTFGTDTYGTRQIAQSPASTAETANLVFAFRLLTLSISALALLALAVFGVNDRMTALLLITQAPALFFAAGNLSFVFEGHQRMLLVAASQILTSASALVMSILVVHASTDVIYVAAIFGFSPAVSVAILIFQYRNNFGTFYPSFDFSKIRRIAHSSFPIFLSGILISTYYTSGVLILNYFSGPTEVGIYSAAQKIVVSIGTIQVMFARAVFPVLSAHYTQTPADLPRMVRMMMRNMCLIGVVAATSLIVSSDLITNILYGAKYVGSADILCFLAIQVGFAFNNSVVSPLLYAAGRQKQHFMAILAGALVNTVMSFGLIPWWGASGAAIGMVLAEGTIFGILAFYAWKYVSVNPLRTLAIPLLLITLTVLSSVLVRGMLPPLLSCLSAITLLIYYWSRANPTGSPRIPTEAH